MRHIDAGFYGVLIQRDAVFVQSLDDIESVDSVSVDVDERGDIDTFIYERLKGGAVCKSLVADFCNPVRYYD